MNDIDWNMKIEYFRINNIICLIFLIEIRKVILRFIFLFIYLLIEYLIKINCLIDQRLNFRFAFRNNNYFFYFIIKFIIKYNILRFIINIEKYRKILKDLSIKSYRIYLNEMIEFIFIFQFINMIIIDIDESNHECDIIFAKRMLFIEDDLVYSWEKYISKIQDNKENMLLIWIVNIWVYNKNKIILYNEILKF